MSAEFFGDEFCEFLKSRKVVPGAAGGASGLQARTLSYGSEKRLHLFVLIVLLLTSGLCALYSL